jgi:hypothetical protein
MKLYFFKKIAFGEDFQRFSQWYGKVFYTFPYHKIFLIFLLAILSKNNVFAQEAAQTEQEIQAAEIAASEETAPAETASLEAKAVIQIKRLETAEPLYSFELRDVEASDLFRILAHDYKLNLLVDNDVRGKITASMTSISLEEALNSIAESLNLKLVKKGNIIRVSPHFVTQVFKLKYLKAADVVGSSNTTESSSTATASAAGN